MIRVFLADDHPVILQGVSRSLDQEPDLRVVGNASQAHELVDVVLAARTDLLVLDLQMPGVDDLARVEAICGRLSESGVATIVFTLHTNPELLRELSGLGVRAVISKSEDLGHLVDAIRRVYAGESIYAAPPAADELKRLTHRERQIYKLHAAGQSASAIALDTGLSNPSVHLYLERIVSKLAGGSAPTLGVSDDHGDAQRLLAGRDQVRGDANRRPKDEELRLLLREARDLSATDVDAGWSLILESLTRRLNCGRGASSVLCSSGPEQRLPGWRRLAEISQPGVEGEPTGMSGGNRYGLLVQLVSSVRTKAAGNAVQALSQLGHGAAGSNAGGDMLVGIHALGADLQLVFALERAAAQPAFSTADHTLLRDHLAGIRRTCHWLALSHGLFPHRRLLTPREREALGHLLGGGSEKEIAPRMGLKTSSLHQLVVSVYRKLAVQSRAELMALWLRAPEVASEGPFRRTGEQ